MIGDTINEIVESNCEDEIIKQKLSLMQASERAQIQALKLMALGRLFLIVLIGCALLAVGSFVQKNIQANLTLKATQNASNLLAERAKDCPRR